MKIYEVTLHVDESARTGDVVIHVPLEDSVDVGEATVAVTNGLADARWQTGQAPDGTGVAVLSSVIEKITVREHTVPAPSGTITPTVEAAL